MVERPARRMPGRLLPNEEWFYAEDAGPSRWLNVVVHSEGDAGRIVTGVRETVHAMGVTIGSTTFDRVAYDSDADVLYLSVGDPGDAVRFEESSEGHALRYDDQGRFVGITIVNARLLLDREGAIVVTPPQLRVEADELGSALVAA